ncbi:PREDICTED: DNA replication factor Cdt1 [Dinoponera quadriceps]|uniref:DNA replication factor Cdt1 n=1 Tax=Dinoponera quadriceps TaxID=609295 RepID=A0A6P3X2E8_DINQU|nr:PREDICTED: DNA replication factor Cdt1 [Dinoponera quadriceps]
MSQPSVTMYFNIQKRRASDDIRGKSKVTLLESNNPKCDINSEEHVSDESNRMVSPKVILRSTKPVAKDSPTAKRAVRNIHFDSQKTNTEKSPMTRVLRSHRLFSLDSQVDIRQSLQNMGAVDVESRKVPFEKKGSLSPKKLTTPKKSFSNDLPKCSTIKEEEEKEHEPSICGSETLTKKTLAMEKLATENLSLNDIKNRINKSPLRLLKLKTSIARYKNLNEKSEKLQAELQKMSDINQPQMQKFEKIELEIPVSPQKIARSPTKTLSTPTKNRSISEAMSPQRRILLEPKDTTPSPVTCSLTKKPAYQRHIAESEKSSLELPGNYKLLAEVFRCVETVSAMQFNRKELITFNKLKPAVQKLLGRNFTLDHLAQIKTIYPDAYIYQQEKHRNFGSVSKTERYELVLTPTVEANDGRYTPDPDDILKSGPSMGPAILLERRRKFYNALLERVKNEHETFLLSLKTPIVVDKQKITFWHPEFSLEACTEIEKAELPQPPQADNATAKDVLDKVKSLFDNGSRMGKALQRLAEAKMTSKSTSPSSTQDSTTQTTENNIPQVNITIVDTPPATPSGRPNSYLTKAFKGIPKSLLEKVRERQAAKALEKMTRTPSADKEATLYARLPEFARTLRYIYISDKKGVLPMETVIQRLNNSINVKLTPNEMDEHLRMLCKLLPTWVSIHNVRDVNYMKLDRNADIIKVIKRLETLANQKIE